MTNSIIFIAQKCSAVKEGGQVNKTWGQGVEGSRIQVFLYVSGNKFRVAGFKFIIFNLKIKLMMIHEPLGQGQEKNGIANSWKAGGSKNCKSIKIFGKISFLLKIFRQQVRF